MKKLVLATLISMSAFSAQAAEYPAECKQLIDLTFEAAEVMPEMKAQLGMDKDTMMKVSVDAWKQMSDTDRKASLDGCKAAVPQMKQTIEAAKAHKK